MNATMLESYMIAHCKWCALKYPGKKIVFYKDNAKYHSREYQINRTQEATVAEDDVKTVEEYLEQKARSSGIRGKRAVKAS